MSPTCTRWDLKNLMRQSTSLTNKHRGICTIELSLGLASNSHTVTFLVTKAMCTHWRYLYLFCKLYQNIHLCSLICNIPSNKIMGYPPRKSHILPPLKVEFLFKLNISYLRGLKEVSSNSLSLLNKTQIFIMLKFYPI